MKKNDISIFIKQFRNIHKTYITEFNKFIKNIEKVFEFHDLSDTEFLLLNKWVNEYKKTMDLNSMFFEDFKSQIVNTSSLELSDRLNNHNDNIDFIKKCIMPHIVLYSIMNTDNDNVD